MSTHSVAVLISVSAVSASAPAAADGNRAGSDTETETDAVDDFLIEGRAPDLRWFAGILKDHFIVKIRVLENFGALKTRV